MENDGQPFSPGEYWEKRLSDRFDLTGVGFRRKSVAFNKWVYRVRTELLDAVVRENDWPIDNKSVLDVGCGTGYFIDYWIARQARPITGIDIAKISIENLRREYPNVNLVLADLSDSNLDLDEKYDYVTIFDVLFHIVDDEKFENVPANLSRFCKPGCKVFITDLFGKNTFAGVKHCRNRSLALYKAAFEKRGFRLLGMRPLFFTLLPPSGLKNPLFRWTGILAWEALTFITRWSLFGNMLGCVLYRIDSILRRMLRKGPGGYLAVFEYNK